MLTPFRFDHEVHEEHEEHEKGFGSLVFFFVNFVALEGFVKEAVAP